MVTAGVVEVRRTGTYIGVYLAIALPIAVPLAVVFGGIWWFVLFGALVAAPVVFAPNEDLARLHHLTSVDIYKTICKPPGVNSDDVGNKQPAKALIVGNLVCPYEDWRDWSCQSASTQSLESADLQDEPASPHLAKPFEVLVAIRPFEYDDRLDLGLSSGRRLSSISLEGEFQSINAEPLDSSEDDLDLAAAVADLMEVIGPKRPQNKSGPTANPVGAAEKAGQATWADQAVDEYQAGWGHSGESIHHALRTVVAAKLAEWPEGGPTAVDGVGVSNPFALADLTRLSRTTNNDRPWPQLAALITLRPEPVPSSDVMDRWIRLLRPTPLGELWRDADRGVRDRAARNELLRWLNGEAESDSGAVDIGAFPSKKRACESHFLSHKDVIRAAEFLKRNGLIEFPDGNPVHRSRPLLTAEGSYRANAGDDISDYRATSRGVSQYNIDAISGSNIAFGSGGIKYARIQGVAADFVNEKISVTAHEITGSQIGSHNAQLIRESFNSFATAHGKEDDLLSYLKTLSEATAVLTAELYVQDANAAQELAETFQSFVEESARETLRTGPLRALGRALIDASSKIPKHTEPITMAITAAMRAFGIPTL